MSYLTFECPVCCARGAEAPERAFDDDNCKDDTPTQIVVSPIPGFLRDSDVRIMGALPVQRSSLVSSAALIGKPLFEPGVLVAFRARSPFFEPDRRLSCSAPMPTYARCPSPIYLQPCLPF